MNRWLSRALLGAALLATATVAAPAQSTALTATSIRSAMDPSAVPGDDWFRYANGTWLDQTTIPADRSSFGAFNIAAVRLDPALTAIVTGAAKARARPGSELRKIGDYYTAYVDSATIDGRGLAPLLPELAAINQVTDRQALARYAGTALRADVDVLNDGDLSTSNLFGLYLERDFARPDRYAGVLMQGGIGLPDKSYYLDTAATAASLRRSYERHVAAMLTMANIPDAKAKATKVLALETKIAATHMSRTDTWEPSNGSHRWARSDFPRLAPGLDWAAFFAAAGLDKADTLIAWQPDAITGIAALTASEPLDAWQALFTYHAIEQRAAVLPRRFGSESFAFFGTTLSGATEQQPRAARAVNATSGALGFAVGHLYVDRYFPASAKAQVEKMVGEIIAAYQQRIDGLDWMAPSTKAEAKRKLATLRVSVGYPDRWPSYDRLEIKADDAYGNAERVALFEYRDARDKIGQPVDRAAWAMVPQQVNAVNLPAMNAMNFPAAILQPPFFDPDRPAAENYASIGAVIGHEISHSFDNLGATFDADGRLRNWWTPADLEHFNAAGAALAAQYDSYFPFPDLHVNGKLTLAENIADLAGLAAAHDAWLVSLDGKPAPMAEGLTGEQQFFLSFGQTWRSKMRDALLRQLVLTNGHAPAQYRSLTVRNFDDWYAAFDVQPGQALYLAPEQRVRVW